MTELSIEDKLIELEKEDYHIDRVMVNDNRYHCLSTPDTEWLSYFGLNEDSLAKAANEGYKHLQKARRVLAMEALLREMNTLMDSYSSKAMTGEEHIWHDKVKAVLGISE